MRILFRGFHEDYLGPDIWKVRQLEVPGSWIEGYGMRSIVDSQGKTHTFIEASKYDGATIAEEGYWVLVISESISILNSSS